MLRFLHCYFYTARAVADGSYALSVLKLSVKSIRRTSLYTRANITNREVK